MFLRILTFFREVLFTRQTVGAWVPSSRALGREISATISPHTSGLRVVEIGPGIGALTQEVIRKLNPEDHLTLIEINPRFCRILREQMEMWKRDPQCPVIELIEGDILQYQPSEKFDHVIASLPLNNFEGQTLLKFLKKFHELSKESGTFSYFEYLGARKLSHWNPFRKRASAKEVKRFFEENIDPYLTGEKKVLGNLPPAKVRHLKFFDLFDSPLVSYHA